MDEEEEEEGDQVIFTHRASRTPKANGPYNLFC